MDHRPTSLERFESKFIKTDGCWEWCAAKTSGYGKFGTGYAHRFSYEIYVDKIPDGLFICHKCDNKLCVNPDHLFPGTNLDNMRDLVEKGLSRKAESHSQAKLTWDQVNKIRQDSRSTYKIATDYNVSQKTINNIKQGKTWRFPDTTKRGEEEPSSIQE